MDGNKRTPLNTVSVYCVLNGHRFSYDDEIVDILKRIASDEATVDWRVVVEYLRSHVEQIELADAVDEWRDDLLAFGVERLSEERSAPND